MSSSHVVTTAVPSVTSQPINGSFYTHSPSTSSTLVVANPPSFNRTSVSCKLLVCLFSLIFENDSVVNIQRIFMSFHWILIFPILLHNLHSIPMFGFGQRFLFSAFPLYFVQGVTLFFQSYYSYLLNNVSGTSQRSLVYSFSVPLVPDVTIVNIDISLQRLIFYLGFSPQLIEAYNVSLGVSLNGRVRG